MNRRLVAAAAAAALLPALAACSGPSVTMQPAENAAAEACAEVSVRLPDTLAGLERRTTNAQATGAWGTPAALLLRCGVTPPGPTTDRCVEVNGIDWVEDASQDPRYVYTTYGRSPALEIAIDSSTGVSGAAALAQLSDVVKYLPETGSACVGADDVPVAP